jgi:hypothetical protein
MVILCALVLAAPAFAASLVRDSEGQKIMAPAWDALVSQAVTSSASQNLPIASLIWYEFQPVADCQARLMNTTNKAAWPRFTIEAGTPFRGSNDALSTKARSVFLNVSGCAGDFRGQ